ncbi:hypothetical protein QBC37DRAFT_486734 [Rhypophila decipiens]|uniref:Secreted protein n=1 Tax=Rhypophila decipiens TaxID=261697 RepID=A0AAN7B0V9_9PEZI|nr:hypothetical protein QBC37DRAFT_486734 [Rhypophila decipiens]
MQLPSFVLLGLAATSVSAIDAYYHLGQNCDGNAIVCSNLNPGVCCSDGRSLANTIGYRGIPTNWVIAARGYGGNQCGDTSTVREVAQNTNFLCLKNRFGTPLGATRYAFGANSKRRDDFSGSEVTESSECQKPDQLVLADGVTKYDIAGLDDDVVDELLKLASEGTAIPAAFHSLKL